MKQIFFFIMMLFVINISQAAVCEDDHSECKNHHKRFCFDDVKIDIDDDTIILMNKKDDETVEFTGDYEMFINGENIDLNARQQELVEEFHTLSFDLIEEAKKIGIEGAKLGVDGAALGLTAVANVFKLLSPHYSSEDFDRDMEKKSQKLEKKAEKLEEKAEKLEVIAEYMEDIRDELKELTPELDELDWF